MPAGRGNQVLLVMRGKASLEEKVSKMPQWAAKLIETQLGQKFTIVDPRVVPRLTFVDFVITTNRHGAAVEEKKVLPLLVSMHALNMHQDVVLEGGAITLRVKKLAPARHKFGQVTWATSVVFNGRIGAEDDDDDAE